MNEVKLRIANGSSEKSNVVKNVAVTWEQMVIVLSDPKVRPGDRSYMLAGQCPSGVRGSKNGDPVESTSLLMIDMDGEGRGGLTWDDLVETLSQQLPFLWAAYTTRSYTGENVRFRIVVPFDGPVSRAHHRSVVDHVMNLLPSEYMAWFDGCSYSPDQPIFLPCVKEKGLPFHSADGGFYPLPISEVDLIEDATVAVMDDDLESIIAATPIDLSADQVQNYLDALDPNTLTYGADEGVFGWADVGMALAHQFGKSDEGFELWKQWSERNKEKHNLSGMRAKYNSFDILPRGKRPITFASVIAAVNRIGGATADVSASGGKSLLEKVLAEASQAKTLDDYNRIKTRVAGMNKSLMPDDARAMVASELVEAFGKDNGLTRTVVTKALSPKKNVIVNEDRKIPAWAKGWCYIEKTCEFYHAPSDHAITKEAVNARYNKEAECLIAEKPASVLMLVDYAIPTFADRMYWPGAGMSFEHEGKMMINSYRDEGVAPVDSICEEGQRAIDLMLGHLEMLVPVEEERAVVLDWFTHVYRNKGQRINWALVMQGAQGTGKSYFGVMMRMLLGSGAQMLDPSAISERFTGWAHGSVLTVVEEMRVSGTSKYNIVDRMKPFITNDVVQIEEKGRDHRDVPNFTSYFMLTNHKDAIPLTKGDRRYCVIYTSIQTEKELFDRLGGDKGVGEYFDDLFGSTMEHAGAIARFFLDRPISESFKAKGRAPDTQSRRTMMALSSSPEKIALEDAIEEHDCDVINDDILDITHLQSLVSLDNNDDFPTRRTLSSVLLELGYEPVDRRFWVKSTRKKHRVWKKSHVDDETLINKFDSFHNQDDAKVRFEFDEDCPF